MKCDKIFSVGRQRKSQIGDIYRNQENCHLRQKYKQPQSWLLPQDFWQPFCCIDQIDVFGIDCVFEVGVFG